MGTRQEWAYSQFQKTGRKPSKTRRLAWSRGFSGLIYALDTESPARPGTTPTFNPRGRTAAQGRVLRKVKTMADSREVMNIRQASQYLGVSPDTLYKYVGEQRIPAFKLGNRWRFKKSKLDQWMEDKSSEVESRPKRKTKAAGAQ